jgi:hypothetical protein
MTAHIGGRAPLKYQTRFCEFDFYFRNRRNQ